MWGRIVESGDGQQPMVSEADDLDGRRPALAVAVEKDRLVAGEDFDGDRFPVEIQDQDVVTQIEPHGEPHGTRWGLRARAGMLSARTR